MKQKKNQILELIGRLEMILNDMKKHLTLLESEMEKNSTYIYIIALTSRTYRQF